MLDRAAVDSAPPRLARPHVHETFVAGTDCARVPEKQHAASRGASRVRPGPSTPWATAANWIPPLLDYRAANSEPSCGGSTHRGTPERCRLRGASGSFRARATTTSLAHRCSSASRPAQACPRDPNPRPSIFGPVGACALPAGPEQSPSLPAAPKTCASLCASPCRDLTQRAPVEPLPQRVAEDRFVRSREPLALAQLRQPVGALRHERDRADAIALGGHKLAGRPWPGDQFARTRITSRPKSTSRQVSASPPRRRPENASKGAQLDLALALAVTQPLRGDLGEGRRREAGDSPLGPSTGKNPPQRHGGVVRRETVGAGLHREHDRGTPCTDSVPRHKLPGNRPVSIFRQANDEVRTRDLRAWENEKTPALNAPGAPQLLSDALRPPRNRRVGTRVEHDGMRQPGCWPRSNASLRTKRGGLR